MGASLLLSVPKTFCHATRKKSVGMTTDDDERLTTMDDGERRRTTTDDGRRWTTDDDGRRTTDDDFSYLFMVLLV